VGSYITVHPESGPAGFDFKQPGEHGCDGLWRRHSYGDFQSFSIGERFAFCNSLAIGITISFAIEQYNP
jgi:hypothetical protein